MPYTIKPTRDAHNSNSPLWGKDAHTVLAIVCTVRSSNESFGEVAGLVFGKALVDKVDGRPSVFTPVDGFPGIVAYQNVGIKAMARKLSAIFGCTVVGEKGDRDDDLNEATRNHVSYWVRLEDMDRIDASAFAIRALAILEQETDIWIRRKRSPSWRKH